MRRIVEEAAPDAASQPDEVATMIPALLGTKIGMTRVRDDAGKVLTVTVVQAGPCAVLQVRNAGRDDYEAVQLGYVDAKPHRSTKPLIGHAAKTGVGPKQHAREVRLAEPASCSEGDVLTVEQFADDVNYVDVAGVTKGRGFSGVMRRHGFGGQTATHGVERKHRAPGSIGGSADLGRGRGVKKGKKMPGHYGHRNVTARNLKLVGIDQEHNLLLIEGSVPGAAGGLLFVRKAKTKV